MRIIEVDNRLQQNTDQYADHLDNRIVDSGPMAKMWQHLEQTGTIPAQLSRSADDYLGLMSKCNPRRGNCAMTRFRSVNMILLNPASRTGRKKATANRAGISQSDYVLKGIHIEHSIPVNLKLKILEAKYAAGIIKTYTDFTDMYTKLSVGVGMTRNEEKNGIQPGYASKHPDITGDLAELNIDSIRPFARYTDNIVIYDMSTGKPVSNTITLANIEIN